MSLEPIFCNELKKRIFQSILYTIAFSINNLSTIGEQFATNCIMVGLIC